MSEIKIINTGKGEIAIIKIPQGAASYSFFGDFVIFSHGDDEISKIELPKKFEFKDMGNSIYLTEDEVRELVPEPMVREIDGQLGYMISPMDTEIYSTAIEAFKAILQANQCYSVNPYLKPDIQYYMSDSAFTMRQYHEELKQWNEAEANTGPWLILRKL